MRQLTNFHHCMKSLPGRCAFAMAFAALLPGCDWMPGKPTRAQQWQAPHDVVDFQKLYAENCLGCHGAQGVISGAIALDNSTWLAVIPRETLRTVIANGVAARHDRVLGGAWRPAHRKADRRACGRHQRLGEGSALGALPAYGGPLEMPARAQPLSRPTARVAMALTEMAPKPAPLSIRLCRPR